MSQKSSRSGKSSSKPTFAPSKSLLKPLAGGVSLLALVTILMYSTTPADNLKPYTKWKNPGAAEQASATSSDSEETANSPDPGLKNRIQPVTDGILSSGADLPKETLEHIAKGTQLMEEGKFVSGEIEFEKAAKISPDSPLVYAIWATARRVQKNFVGADKKFARAYELSPDNEEIAFNWGVTKLLGGEDIDGAIKMFQKTVELNPNHFWAYNSLGKAFGRKNKYKEEADSYRKALKIKPNFALAHFNLGITLSLLKNFHEAAPHFETALEFDPQFDKPFVRQMLSVYGTGKIKPKTAELKESSKIADSKTAQGEEAQSEGSGHKMEGSSSKIEKATTNVAGQILINGEKAPSNMLVILETKDKLPVPGQTVQNLVITQKGFQFSPQHSVVQVKSTLTFVNEDNEPHNIYSKSTNNKFNLGVMATGASKSLVIKDGGPIVLRCNIHPDMVGTIFIVPNGYFTKTSKTGEYAFKDVKSKEYLMRVWQPRLLPEEVARFTKSIGLIGKDKVYDFDIKTVSQPGEIHDMVDKTDYNAIVDSIETLLFTGIESWKQGKKYLPRKRILMAITKHYDGEGLKGTIAKSFSPKRSQELENQLDDIRKNISGIKTDGKKVTEEILKQKAKRVIAQLRNSVRELQARLDPNTDQ